MIHPRFKRFDAIAVVAAALSSFSSCDTRESSARGAADADSTRAAAAADEALLDVADRLAAAEAFTFVAERHLDPGLLPGREYAEEATVTVEVRRPDRVHAVARSASATRHFYYDGQNVTIFDETKNRYAVAPVTGPIDSMAVWLDEQFGFTPPLVEFMTSDLYVSLEDQLIAKRMRDGNRMVGGRECRRLAFHGEMTDGELFIAPETGLPCGFEAVARDIEGNPAMRVTFTEWNLDADLTEERFTFTPPAEAKEIPFVLRAQAATAPSAQ